MTRQALGLIEAVGLAAAIEAADTAIKAANVTLLGYEMTRGNGMITIKLVGDVGAVKAAVTAGVMAGNRVNEIYSYHVIPRPHPEIDRLIANVDRGPGQGDVTTPVPLGNDGGPSPAGPLVAEDETEEESQAEKEAESAAEETIEPQVRTRRCAAITQEGTRCRLRAKSGSDYCHVHQPAAADSEEEE